MGYNYENKSRKNVEKKVAKPMYDLILSIIFIDFFGIFLGSIQLMAFHNESFKKALKRSIWVVIFVDILLIFIYIKWRVAIPVFSK